ncbi:MAG: hypothetical protein ACOH17_09950 [Cellulomonas sp.]
MNTMVRDLAILGALIAVGLLWSLLGLVTRRRQRVERKVARQSNARETWQVRPIPGLAERASALRWVGPSTDGPPEESTADYVRAMVRTFAGEASVLLHDNFRVGPTCYANVFTGDVDGWRVRLGNAFVNLAPSSPAYVGSGTDVVGSFVVIDLPAVLPPLVVALRRFPPYNIPFAKEWTLESADVNRRFLVMALDHKYANDMLSPRVMELVMGRDDWTFVVLGSRLVCVCATPFTGVDEVMARVGAVSRFAELIPNFVEQDRGLSMPTLPDGSAFDPSDPASIETMRATMMAMTPTERAVFIAQIQHAGARFVLGAFGKGDAGSNPRE